MIDSPSRSRSLSKAEQPQGYDQSEVMVCCLIWARSRSPSPPLWIDSNDLLDKSISRTNSSKKSSSKTALGDNRDDPRPQSNRFECWDLVVDHQKWTRFLLVLYISARSPFRNSFSILSNSGCFNVTWRLSNWSLTLPLHTPLLNTPHHVPPAAQPSINLAGCLLNE